MSRHNRERKRHPKSLTVEEQQERHTERAEAHRKRYPVAPTYRDDNPHPYEGEPSVKPQQAPKPARPGRGFRHSGKRR